MMRIPRCVSKQIEVLILMKLAFDREYYRYGIRTMEAVSTLHENKATWMKAGVPDPNKEFEKRIRWALSALKKQNILRIPNTNCYAAGKRFDEGLQERIYDLVEELELELDFGSIPIEKMDKASIIASIRNGTIEVSMLDSIRSKRLSDKHAQMPARLGWRLQ